MTSYKKHPKGYVKNPSVDGKHFFEQAAIGHRKQTCPKLSLILSFQIKRQNFEGTTKQETGGYNLTAKACSTIGAMS